MTDSPRADGRPNGDNQPILTDDDMAEIVRLKMTGMSDQAISEQVGVSRATVQRFVNRPAFVQALNAAHKEVLDTASRRLATAAAPALHTLLRAMDMNTRGVPWSVRVRASETVFRMLGMERLAGAIDHQAAATLIAARDTLRDKLAAMEPKVIEATELRVVEDDDEATGT